MSCCSMNRQTFQDYQQESSPCPMTEGRVNKRTFIKALAGLFIAWVTGFWGFFQRFGHCGNPKVQAFGTGTAHAANDETTIKDQANAAGRRLGVEPDGRSRVHLAQGDTPENNMAAILESMGGIETFISPQDIVILKPNAQWWAQGMTNTDAMKAFMDAVLAIPRFEGEIIIADNHQYAEPNSRGWTTEERNGKYNYNELVEHFQKRGYRNVTKYHWRGAGPNPSPIEGDDQLGSKIVEGPGQGDGYVWSSDIVYMSRLGRRCLLTWPVFTSAHSGVTIDFKNGAWKDGSYTGQPVKFINFAAINHHGPYVGVTAAVKNYMGIVDMTCGFQGSTPRGYYNTHFIGLRDLHVPLQDKLPWRVQKWVRQYNWKYFEHTGGVLGTFMREVRMADMNFITAHWIGWGSRTRTDKSGKPKALLASIDPVAIDYVAAQEILMPLTRSSTQDEFIHRMNDASLSEEPYQSFLRACYNEGIGNFEGKHIQIERVSG